MRSLFAADYTPPAGGGGRFYLMLGALPAAFEGFTGFAYDGPLPTVNVASQASCPRASEMVVSTISAERHWVPGMGLAHETIITTLNQDMISRQEMNLTELKKP